MSANSTRQFLSTNEALVQLAVMQSERDRAAGLNTAGFVSGYRGSPLAGLDKELWKQGDRLSEHDIRFVPGLNEDLAATAIWGSQQLDLRTDAQKDGVFSMWYGKGPGVDRTGDVFRHANVAGTAKHGGVLAVAGDDHGCQSSTVAHQTDHNFSALMMPVIYPAGIQEILDYGLISWAMSRYAGVWIGFKCVTEVVESAASVDVDPFRVDIRMPDDFEMPEGGLNIRWPDTPLAQEERLQRHKVYAALAFARANKLDRVVWDSPKPRLGIITPGKSYLDVRQALSDMGIDEARASELGLRLYKVGMPWPLEPEGVRAFATGLDEIIVVEEKRALIENQLKEQLYNWDPKVRPRVVGKFDEDRQWLLPSEAELTPAMIALVIADRLAEFADVADMSKRVDFVVAKEEALVNYTPPMARQPHYCAGCPHNTSTKVPDGSEALAGIGCHYMATWIYPDWTRPFSQMGGEGVAWVGQSPYCKTDHVFANIGDGTYYHSGLLAIRASIAAEVNITYKLLFNDAVAMTGGQPVDGPLTIPGITYQLKGEGVETVVLVTDDMSNWKGAARATLAPNVTVRPREEVDAVQRELRETKGCTVLIYEQTCATEKRRRRKRGTMEDPKVRLMINPDICEACGDCGVQSNCLAVETVDTPLGTKRAIDQSACNKDYTCNNGQCPAFVTITGGAPRKLPGVAADQGVELPAPTQPSLDKPFDAVIAGIGGTGVVTISTVLANAAFRDGRAVSKLDMTGLAQKYGAVHAHVRIAEKADDLHALRVAAGNARLLLGCDLIVSASYDALAKTDKGVTTAIINTFETPTGELATNRNWQMPTQALRDTVTDHVGDEATHFINASELATRLLGDAVFANMLMLGYAWQKGLVPVSESSLLAAIKDTGVAVDRNIDALTWGRRMAHDADAVLSKIDGSKTANAPKSLDQIIDHRAAILIDYQDKSYADRYRSRVAQVRDAEIKLGNGSDDLGQAVAENLFKLMAYKDEYEVARLHTSQKFRDLIARQFDGDYSVSYNLAPPVIAKRDPHTGRLIKSKYGPWIETVFGGLKAIKGLRGSALDLFGRQGERVVERQLIAEYETTLDELVACLSPDTQETAVAIARIPDDIRGFGQVKAASIEAAKVRKTELMAQLRA